MRPRRSPDRAFRPDATPPRAARIAGSIIVTLLLAVAAAIWLMSGALNTVP